MQAVPSFTWKPVKGAASYDFQLAGDRRFGSIVLGTGRGRGSFRTRNTAATIGETLSDGTYYWRVRAVSAKDKAGKWSSPRELTKAWTEAPQIVGPIDDLTVSWPLAPLVLQWSPVAHATGYQVAIATDPGLSNVVFGDAAKPVVTQGTVLAFPSTLAPGTYYWAVTPINAQGHKGTRSRTARFGWTWPTRLDAPQMRVTDMDPAAAVFDPQLSWDPIPGATSYDVEVSSDRDFAPGSTVCCSERTIGTSISPPKILANNTGSGEPELRWRVRAVDTAGNAQDWNYGPAFDESYPATIDGLRVVRDNPGDAAAGTGGAVPDTAVPVLTWNQVPGASSYEVRVVPYESYGCNWSASTSESWNVVTATTAWTPLGNPASHRPVGVLTDLTPFRDSVAPINGRSYCVRVRAQRDRDVKNRPVVSDWTTLNVQPDGAGPAFRYTAATTSGILRPTAEQDYLQPAAGSARTWTPLYTWKPVPGARGYFVVVARDSAFTKVVDLAFTNVPAYAPRRGNQPWTYPDESGAYWWSVVPTAEPDGDGAVTAPTQDAPQTFSKNSSQAGPIDPAPGATVVTQPAFRWTAVPGARAYTLQVDTDASFRTPIVNVTTASTSYTATATLPADTALYWRVRANDERNIGLQWSEGPRTFRRTLPVPALADENPREGTQIPLLQWKPVQGAIAYDVHIDQPDGTRRDFTTRTTAFAPSAHYGTGIWTWMVRARFPTTTNQTVPGGYSPALGFLRHLDPPTGVQALRNSSRTLISWNADPSAHRYRVETSATDGFGTRIESATTDNASWAPDLTRTAYGTVGKVYWRVAVVDSGRTVGAYATGVFTLLRPPVITVSGKPRRGHKGRLLVKVASPARKAIAKARVSVRGGGMKAARKVTSKLGTTVFRVRPRKAGTLAVRVEARGYRTTTVRVRVRKR